MGRRSGPEVAGRNSRGAGFPGSRNHSSELVLLILWCVHPWDTLRLKLRAGLGIISVFWPILGCSEFRHIREWVMSFDFVLNPSCSLQVLVPPPGIEPGATVVKAQSPNHWTAREVPWATFFVY